MTTQPNERQDKTPQRNATQHNKTTQDNTRQHQTTKIATNTIFTKQYSQLNTNKYNIHKTKTQENTICNWYWYYCRCLVSVCLRFLCQLYYFIHSQNAAPATTTTTTILATTHNTRKSTQDKDKTPSNADESTQCKQLCNWHLPFGFHEANLQGFWTFWTETAFVPEYRRSRYCLCREDNDKNTD